MDVLRDPKGAETVLERIQEDRKAGSGGGSGICRAQEELDAKVKSGEMERAEAEEVGVRAEEAEEAAEYNAESDGEFGPPGEESEPEEEYEAGGVDEERILKRGHSAAGYGVFGVAYFLQHMNPAASALQYESESTLDELHGGERERTQLAARMHPTQF